MWHSFTDPITGRAMWRYVCPGDRVIIIRGAWAGLGGTVITIRGDGVAAIVADGQHPDYPCEHGPDDYVAPESTHSTRYPFPESPFVRRARAGALPVAATTGHVTAGVAL